MKPALSISDLRASVGEATILKGLDLEVPFGEIHAIMGPNGSGKSTTCHVLTGHPAYEVSGTATLDGIDLLDKSIEERAQLGLLQGFQYPTEIPGVPLRDFMIEAGEERGLTTDEVEARIETEAKRFDMTPIPRSSREQRSVRRREEAFGDLPDGGARPEDDAARRDRLRPRHRRGPPSGGGGRGRRGSRSSVSS